MNLHEQEPVSDIFICSICRQPQSQPGEPLNVVLKRFFRNHNNIHHAGEGRLVRPQPERQQMIVPRRIRGRRNKILPETQQKLA